MCNTNRNFSELSFQSKTPHKLFDMMNEKENLLEA